MRLPWLLAAIQIGVPAFAAPPPDSNGQYRDWFRSLSVPGAPGLACCTVADCRMVESRWNVQTTHYEAKVVRELFSNALQNSPLYEKDPAAFHAAKQIWVSKWITRYGDVSDAWIEIPEAKVNQIDNPTGRAVLCWSTFYPDFNGVFCFIPFQAASNDLADRTRWYG